MKNCIFEKTYFRKNIIFEKNLSEKIYVRNSCFSLNHQGYKEMLYTCKYLDNMIRYRLYMIAMR